MTGDERLAIEVSLLDVRLFDVDERDGVLDVLDGVVEGSWSAAGGSSSPG